MGFFTGSELSKKSKKKIDVNQLNPECGKCGLSKKCLHPKIKYTGEGKKEILIISEFITQEEDEFGIHLVGEQGEVLKKEFRKVGISLHKDCWKIAAVNCNTPRNRIPTHKEEIKC
jgi:uracil-DNA glycosylase family 4